MPQTGFRGQFMSRHASQTSQEVPMRPQLLRIQLRRTSENSVTAHFREIVLDELRRTPLRRSSQNTPSTRLGAQGGGSAATRILASPHGYEQPVWRRCSRGGVGPLELELDLFLAPLPLVLDVELRSGGHVDPLPGHLYLEPLARLQSVGQPAQLRYKLGGGVDLLDVPVWLFAHQCSLGSLNSQPFGILSGPRGRAKSPRGGRRISQVGNFLKLSSWRSSQNSSSTYFVNKGKGKGPEDRRAEKKKNAAKTQSPKTLLGSGLSSVSINALRHSSSGSGGGRSFSTDGSPRKGHRVISVRTVGR